MHKAYMCDVRHEINLNNDTFVKYLMSGLGGTF